MARTAPLSSDLRSLYVALRRQACLGEPLKPATCKRLALALGRLARKADDIEAQAAESSALEDELFAVAQDLDRVAGDDPQPSFQTALKAQQRSLQAQLDWEDSEHGDRGLARLSAPIGESNVVTFPVMARLQAAFDDGGDAA